ncbi:MAG: transcriptional regulator [Legionella sp.]|jgi:hypothetical protein|nr:transcriptional regulator [Legionella sp.]
MEHFNSYNIQGGIRPECLHKPNRWEKPTGEEIKVALSMAGWSGVELSRRIDTNDRTVRRWLSGDQPIPYAVWCILCVEANLGQIWK